MLAIRKFIHWCVDRLTEWLYNSTKGIDSCIDGVAPRSKQIHKDRDVFWPRMIEKKKPAQNLTLIVIKGKYKVNLNSNYNYPQGTELCT